MVEISNAKNKDIQPVFLVIIYVFYQLLQLILNSIFLGMYKLGFIFLDDLGTGTNLTDIELMDI